MVVSKMDNEKTSQQRIFELEQENERPHRHGHRPSSLSAGKICL